jgi:circadian clock protein KaiB
MKETAMAKPLPASRSKKLNGKATAAPQGRRPPVDSQLYVLRLCVTGMNLRSRQAVTNIKRLCEDHLKGRYHLEVIDLYQHPELAAKHEVIATPTLLKHLPPPVRRLIGDLSNTVEALRRLGITVTSTDK